ncbi:MAG: hypothetical protein Sylvanvirus7_23 [Sylvanvirus sp.]|uniref:Uncharacterized protein n=1 Tax=Sylvanvirus sp. TaxID=2487774 RepID=A0A3G5AHP0_9VIRU|nr:MAG: hypothetical protein Sylvanvirus7_23 [Sylvanvirus sp.]
MSFCVDWLSRQFSSVLNVTKEEIKEGNGKQSEFWFQDPCGSVKFVVKRPYHCPRCKFIWDTKKRFRLHISCCLLGDKSVSEYAIREKAFYFDTNKQSKSDILTNRCKVKLATGLRKGKYCLRENIEKCTRCSYHEAELTKVQ